MSAHLLGVVTLIYFSAALLFLVARVFQRPRLDWLARGGLVLGWGGHTGALIYRWLESYQLGIGHAPLSNFYESLVFCSWSLVGVVCLGFWRQTRAYLGALVATLAFLLLAYASLGGVDSRITPLIPALRSNWLEIHVITCFISYAAFALGFGAALLYLIRTRQPRPSKGEADPIPSAGELDHLIYRTIVIGFFMLTLGILTGAVWAEAAWGTYWSWDPKETWSLITWLIYAALLHARLVKGWQGKRIAILAVVGFLAVLFTYFGVSFLLPGLHAYLT
ncbi:MAG: c-type cytochrome biogenesis protein CcsB [Deltaproteobacteria bacterium]|nr:c-type cytochrome biogenesis protein CcsB [Deltaproteobacteria bacterium]MBW1952895.1 c-type cytochrome biogenesis protein CcsB [Deltaproteobacteria bacterium]MBW1987129.1 c-type cytochrome biogenesis protein CcsB [Deltaproteobacteria bacterium]MBW2135341.1 c-type cytochrome biogenesis protein CcsB [Deltaproteobacteria bacterium]